MYGDFSRDSFDACKQHTRVLMQQGRPLTDADWNEQVSAIWERMATLARTVIGWHGTSDSGFEIANDSNAGGYILKVGTYFIDGVMCENTQTRKLTMPPPSVAGDRIVYLEAWEQSVNGIEDQTILESALRGIDTAVRSKIVWALKYTATVLVDNPNNERQKFLDAVTGPQRGRLRARRAPATTGVDPKSPCATVTPVGQPATFTDRLYRVEIHRTGSPAKPTDNAETIKNAATFKWSRENGSVVAALSSLETPSGQILKTDGSKFSSRVAIRPQAWVELFDVDGRSANANRELLRVETVSSQEVTLKQTVAVQNDSGQCLVASFDLQGSNGYYLRQWDHDGTALGSAEKVESRIVNKRLPGHSAIAGGDGAAVIVADANDNLWLELETGIDVQFSGNSFQQGDYWWIRTTSDGRVVVLPDAGPNCAVAPRGAHHFAPMGKMTVTNGSLAFNNDFRKPFFGPGVQYPAGSPSGCSPCSPPPTAEVPPEPANRVAPAEHGVNIQPTSLLLSREGEHALKAFLSSPKDVTRGMPARYLNHEPQSAAYRRFRAALLVSEILEPGLAQFLEKVRRCLPDSEEEWAAIEQDARTDYALATAVAERLASGGGPSVMA